MCHRDVRWFCHQITRVLRRRSNERIAGGCAHTERSSGFHVQFNTNTEASSIHSFQVAIELAGNRADICSMPHPCQFLHTARFCCRRIHIYHTSDLMLTSICFKTTSNPQDTIIIEKHAEAGSGDDLGMHNPLFRRAISAVCGV